MSPHLPARQVYHLADAANWASIERLGLLSASRLMELAGLTEAQRKRIECAQRRASVTLPTGAVLRDQVPMPPAALVRCLIGMTPAEWYALVNSKVFFWFDPDRLDRQRRAGAASPRAVVMTVDAQRLLAAHGARAALSAINTGALGTRPRARSHPPAELTVEDSVPDAMDFVLSLRHLDRDEPFTP